MQWCSGKLQAQQCEEIKQQEGTEGVLAPERMPPFLERAHLVVNCLLCSRLPTLLIYQKNWGTHIYIYVCFLWSIPGPQVAPSHTDSRLCTHSSDRQRCFGDDHLGSGVVARRGIWHPSWVQGQPSLLCVHRKGCLKNKIPLKVVVLPADTDWGLSTGFLLLWAAHHNLGR